MTRGAAKVGKAAMRRRRTREKPSSGAKTTRRRAPSATELQKQLTEALEQQAATSEVLKIISSSSGELEPLFQAMLEKATRICDARFGTLFRFDGSAFYLAAEVGTPPKLAEVISRHVPF
jgi:hypothetical protein